MTMRQNTRRTAFEMFRRGFSVSDAALQESALHVTHPNESKVNSHCNELHPLKREAGLNEDSHPT
jgi:hypothetical protein